MTPHNTIDSTLLPLTVDALAEQLAVCGLAAGQTVLVHSAISKLGWVAGRRGRGGSGAAAGAGQRKWVTFQMPRLDTDDFDSIGAAYEAAHGIQRHRVGRAEARPICQRPLVDFAVQWMNAHRSSVNGQGNDS